MFTKFSHSRNPYALAIGRHFGYNIENNTKDQEEWICFLMRPGATTARPRRRR